MAIIRELNQEQRFELLDPQTVDRDDISGTSSHLDRLERRLRETALANASDAELFIRRG